MASTNKTTRSATGAKKATKARSPKVTGAKAKPVAARTHQGRAGIGSKPTTIDEYLAQVDADTRRVLEKLRQTIRRLVPDAEECISYSMPAFRFEGKVIGGFAATANGGSYYPFSGSTLGTLAAALRGYSQTKSAVHFTLEAPLPATLVDTLLKARIAEL